MTAVKQVFHTSVWVLLSYSLYFNVTEIRVKKAPDVITSVLTYDGFGGKFKYLTFWYFVSACFMVLLNIQNTRFMSKNGTCTFLKFYPHVKIGYFLLFY